MRVGLPAKVAARSRGNVDKALADWLQTRDRATKESTWRAGVEGKLLASALGWLGVWVGTLLLADGGGVAVSRE